MTFSDTLKGTKEGTEKHIAADDPALIEEIGQDAYDKLMEEIELLDGASAEFDMDLVTKGQLSPVFFGSALTNFGVETFLQHFLRHTVTVSRLCVSVPENLPPVWRLHMCREATKRSNCRSRSR